MSVDPMDLDDEDFISFLHDMLVSRAKLMAEEDEIYEGSNGICSLITDVLESFDMDQIKDGIMNVLNPMSHDRRIQLHLDDARHLTIITRLAELQRLQRQLPTHQDVNAAMSLQDVKEKTAAMVDVLNRLVVGKKIELAVDEVGHLHATLK